MAARDIQLADAVVAAINGQSWELEFDAVREYVTDWNLDRELSSLQCAVLPRGRLNEAGDRNRMQQTDRLLVCFGQRLIKRTREEIDTLLEQTEAVIDFLERRTEVSSKIATNHWTNVAVEDLLRFDEDALQRDLRDLTTVYSGTLLTVTRLDYLYLSTA